MKIEQVWSTLSSADRHVLLGHDNDTLSPADKIRLMKVAALAKKPKEAK